jgi:hypothetical protein
MRIESIVALLSFLNMSNQKNVNPLLSKLIGGPLAAILSATPLHVVTLRFKQDEEEATYQHVLHILRRNEHRRVCFVYMAFGIALPIFDFIFVPQETFRVVLIAIHLIIIPMCSFPYVLFRCVSPRWFTAISFASLFLSILFLNVVPELVLLRDCQSCIFYPAKIMFQVSLVFLFCAQSFDVVPTFVFAIVAAVIREIVYKLSIQGSVFGVHDTILLVLEIVACTLSCYQIARLLCRLKSMWSWVGVCYLLSRLPL